MSFQDYPLCCLPFSVFLIPLGSLNKANSSSRSTKFWIRKKISSSHKSRIWIQKKNRQIKVILKAWCYISTKNLSLANQKLPRLGSCFTHQNPVPRGLLNSISNTSSLVAANGYGSLADSVRQVGKSTGVPVTDDGQILIRIDVKHFSFGCHGRCVSSRHWKRGIIVRFNEVRRFESLYDFPISDLPSCKVQTKWNIQKFDWTFWLSSTTSMMTFSPTCFGWIQIQIEFCIICNRDVRSLRTTAIGDTMSVSHFEITILLFLFSNAHAGSVATVLNWVYYQCDHILKVKKGHIFRIK